MGRKKTTLYNCTKFAINLKSGNAGIYSDVTTIAPGQDHVVYTITNETYKDYWCAVQPNNDKVILSSDDCIANEAIEIKSTGNDLKKFVWEGTGRGHARGTGTRVAIGTGTGAATGNGTATGIGVVTRVRATTGIGATTSTGVPTGTGAATGTGVATGNGVATDTGVATNTGAATDTGATTGIDAAAETDVATVDGTTGTVAATSIRGTPHTTSSKSDFLPRWFQKLITKKS